MARELSTAAQCAKMIRAELRQKFPTIKFEIRSESFAGGNAVNINYIDGVPSDKVDSVVKKYQYGHFDGMQDIYEYSNVKDGVPQTKFVMVSRHLSPEVEDKIKTKIAKEWDIDKDDQSDWMRKMGKWPEQAVWQAAQELTF